LLSVIFPDIISEAAGSSLQPLLKTYRNKEKNPLTCKSEN